MVIDTFIDIETGDPDDLFMLALFATHPRSNLLGVTVHPGGKDQIGVVKRILYLLGKNNVPVGSGSPKNNNVRVSGFAKKWVGDYENADPDGKASEILSSVCDEKTWLITGAALTNIYEAWKIGLVINGWTCQGGFVGSNCLKQIGVEELPKFKEKEMIQTWNLGGNKEASQVLLESSLKSNCWMVGKNVCHGIMWDQKFQSQVGKGIHAGLDLILDGMKIYFNKKPDGKALHDVIAAVMALNHDCGMWLNVKPKRNHMNEWGCEIDNNSPIKALVSVNIQSIINTLER